MKKIAIFTGVISLVLPLINCAPVNADDIDFSAVRPEMLYIKFSKSGIAFDFDNFDLQVKTVQVFPGSNLEQGFKVSIKSADEENNSLRHMNPLISENIPAIETQVTSANLPVSGWGYDADGDDAFDAVPLIDTETFTATEPGEKTFDFSVAARSDENLPYGRYTNGIIFTIVPNN